MARGDPTPPDVALKRGSQGYGDPHSPSGPCLLGSWRAQRPEADVHPRLTHGLVTPLDSHTLPPVWRGPQTQVSGGGNRSQPQQVWTRLPVEGRLTNTGVSKRPLWGSKPLFCLSRGDVTTPKLLIKTKQSKSEGKWCSGRGQASAGKGKTPCAGLWVYSRDSGSPYRSHQAPWAVGKGVRVGGGVGDHQHRGLIPPDKADPVSE